MQVVTGSSGAWAWKKPSGAITLASGRHTLYIKVREDGAQVDKIAISPVSTAPTGLGGTALTPQTDGSSATATPPATSTATPPATATATATNTPTATSVPSPATPTATSTATATTTASPTATSGTGGSRYYALDASQTSYIEAEQYTAATGAFAVVNDTSRSGGQYMHTPNGSGDTPSTSLAYDLAVTNGGTVSIYLLSTGPDGSSDSFYLALDQGADAQVTTGSSGAWAWKKPSGAITLASGRHTLYIKVREDGAQVDKIAISPVSTAPTGLGGTALTPQTRTANSTGPLLARVAATQPVVAQAQAQPASVMQTWGNVMQAPLQQTSVQTRTITYGYDGLSRLTSAQESGATTNSYTYAYDTAGNRTDGGRSYNAANQVIGWSYDAAGNLQSDGASSYTYDALNRAVTIGSTANAYNADGVLVQQGTTRYTQDLAAPLSQVLSDGTSTYVYGTERLFAQQSTTRTWYATDALGSVRQTLSNSGAVLGNIAYDPWGQVQRGNVPTFGFTGEIQQGANVYLRARWYNTQQGTFTSKDSFAGWPAQPYSLHQYQYAYSAPTTWTDPSGQAVSAGDAGGVGPCPTGWTRIGSRCEPSGMGGGGGGSWTPNPSQGFVAPPGFVPPAPAPAAPPAPAPVAPPPAPVPPVAPAPGPGPVLAGVGTFLLRCASIVGWAFILSGDSAQDLPAPQPLTPQPTPNVPTPTPQRMSIFKPGNDTPQTTQHIITAISVKNKPAVVTYKGKNQGYDRRWLAKEADCQGQSSIRWCDEYPFNSVLEGGQLNKPSLQLVPANEQRIQGGAWNGFLRNCKVVPGEKVVIAPSLSLPKTTWSCKT